MSVIPPKVKEGLARLYDDPDYKYLEQWNEIKASEFLEQVLGVDMSSLGADKRVAMLQGQVLAHRLMLLEIKKIHKENVKD